MGTKIDRRLFLKTSLTASGALLVSVAVPGSSRAMSASLGHGTMADGGFHPNAFIKIAKDGKVTIVIGQSEMGQGVLTSLAMIVAEELEADWSKVSYESGPPDKAFINPLIGSQVTGGSTSVRAFFMPLRKAGATVREMLVSAAAQGWGVAPETCKAGNSMVTHAASGRSAGYGELLDAAAKITLSTEPKLKDPKEFKLIGKSVKRLDTPEKVNGTAEFGIDVNRPGMLFGSVQRAPVPRGTVKSVDDAPAKAVKGVVAVVNLGYGVGVVAQNYFAARKGRQALKIVWDEGSNATLSSEAILASYKDAAAKESGKAAKSVGNVATARSGAAKTVEAEYFAPFLAHATMEPMNCTADVRADGADVWCGTQSQLVVQGSVAKALGLAPEKVGVHTMLLGGGFGRRVGVDYVMDAVMLSKAAGKPVKVVWTREDDTQNDFFRPATFNKLSAGLGADGKPVFWHHKIVNGSIMGELAPAVFGFPFPADQMDDSSYEGAHNLPYSIPNFQVDWIRKDTGIPLGFWRSVGSSHTAFSVECFLDELAAAAGKDPLEYRLSLLDPKSRFAGVLKLAAEKAGWSTKPAAGVGRGIAVAESFGSYVAQVAEVSVGKDGSVKVNRVVCAVDCGQTVNPDTIEAQMEGGIIYGLTAALYGEITVKNGRIQQGNFNNYKMLRMGETPKIEVHILPSSEPHGGVGEPGTPPIAPAVVNAIFAATGKRIRSLPIRAEDITG